MQPNSKTKIGWVAGIVAVWLAGLATVQAADFTSWAKKMPIQFTGYTRTETLTNFPALVTFTNGMVSGFSYADFLSTNADLRFTDATQTNELNYEIEKWATNGSSFVWVQVPLLTNNTSIYAFWGLSGRTAPAYTTNGGTWTNGYAAVWHLAETNLTPGVTGGVNRDSTANGNHGTQYYTGSTTNGKIAGAQVFDGAGDYIGCGSGASLDVGAVRTISAWINPTTLKPYASVVGKNSGRAGPHSYLMCCHTNGGLTAYDGGTWRDSAAAGVAAGNWYHVAYVTKGDGNIYFYVNGQSAGSATWSHTDDPTDNVYIGSWRSDVTSYDFAGVIDEVSIASVVRSSNWVWACYLNQASNGVFATNFPVYSGQPGIQNGSASNVTASSATLSGTLSSTGSAPIVAVSVYWGTNDGGTVAANWSNNAALTPVPQAAGSLSTNITGLLPNALYYYRFFATNSLGGAWADSSALFFTDTAGITALATTPNASESGPVNGVFTLTRSVGSTNVALTVTYALAGSASNGVDYASLNGQATFLVGATNTTVTVIPIADGIADEGTETVDLTLTDGGGVPGTPSNATVNIADGTWYVATNGLDTHGGASWADALATISNGVAKAQVGDVVLVSNGVYIVTTNILLDKGITVKGFAGSSNTFVTRGAAATTNRLFVLSHPGAVLDGLTLTNGYLPSTNGYGGAVLMTNGTIRNCSILNNYSAERYGGGLYMVAGLVSNCLVANNRTDASAYSDNAGGGIYMVNGVVVDSVVSNNWVAGWHRSGGGIHMQNGLVANSLIISNRVQGAGSGGGNRGGGINMANGTVSNCTFVGNACLESGAGGYSGGGGLAMDAGTARSCVFIGNRVWSGATGGGGAYLRIGSPNLINSLIYGNTSASVGGGVKCDAGQMLNCTIVSNTAPSSQGGGIHMTVGTVENTIAYFNTAVDTPNANVTKSGGTFRYSCSTPLVSGGADTNNAAGDPSFVAVAATNFHLLPSSSCVDTGTNNPAVMTDIEGTPRPLDGNGDSVAIHDMGAYELDPAAGPLVCDFTGAPVVGLNSLTAIFTNSISGSNTNNLQYWWNFGNGTMNGPGLRIVTNTYSTYGRYSVSLTVSNAFQGASKVQAGYITVARDADTFVALGGGSVYPYDSWDNAATNILDAVDELQTAVRFGATQRTVWIGDGAYTLAGVVDITTNITVQSTNGPAGVILNGSAATRAFNVGSSGAIVNGITVSNGNAATASGIYLTAGLVTNCVIRNGTNTWGVAMAGGLVLNCQIVSNAGGGLYVSGGATRNSTVSGNTRNTGNNGAGAYVAGGELSGCTVAANRIKSALGSGVYLTGGTVSNCTIQGNYDLDWNGGAGVHLNSGLLTHSLIVSNYTDNGGLAWGGGMRTAGGTAQYCRVIGNYARGGVGMNSGGVRLDGGILRNCLVAGNETKANGASTGYGAGIYLNGGRMENCTVTRNATHLTSGSAGGGVYWVSGTATNCIVAFNNAVVSSNVNTATGFAFSCAPELTDGTNGNLTADPFFMAMGAGYGTNATLGNYQLQRRSPCANAGTNRTWMTNAVDLAGDPRIKNDIVDMGAYEVLLPPSGTVFKMR